jgi:hypothetical protein
MREVNTVALVFPKNPAIDNLISATAHFERPEDGLVKERLAKLLDALEGLRQKGLVKPDVLG